MLQRVCEGAGYRTITCESGDKALLALEAHSEIALIVTDVIMPGMDGRTLHDRVVAMNVQVPFLFCSGYTSTLLTADVLSLRGRDFLAKPFLPDALLEKVARVDWLKVRRVSVARLDFALGIEPVLYIRAVRFAARQIFLVCELRDELVGKWLGIGIARL